MGKFLEMDLRNGALRRKYDALKYTLKVGGLAVHAALLDWLLC